jgi:cell division protein FtsI/penicillin-binding protein 2
VQQLLLSVQPGARSVQLLVTPLAFHPAEDEKYRHLWVDHGQLRWQALPAASHRTTVGGTQAGSPAALQLVDRHGTALWHDGASTAEAAQAGLAPLLGLAHGHGSSVAGMLARLPGVPQQARLTLDLPLQALSQQVLECVGLRHGRWDGAQCHGGGPVPEGRHAGLVILDAEKGDILAAAGAGMGHVSAANWAEVRDFDRTSPARSPLRLPAWQHDGGAHQSPGSTFKVVTALGLELAAQQDHQLDALLSGLPLPALNRVAQQRGFGFQTDAASYPLNPRLAHVTNYREQSLERRAQDGKLGLAQALTYSLNTWFAWTGELSDRSLFGRAEGGAPDLQALDAGALDSIRPIVAAAHKLGFEQRLRLDGGLLPADYDWRNWDALQATPAHIDPIHTRHELRQMSIGLRMQVTPLQMALASAAIAQGAVVTPRLLLALDGSNSVAPAQPPLGIRLDRIRAGMKGVVDTGTGAGAFRSSALAALRPGLYGKTGTAPSGPDSATVWFTGWLEAGSLPGQRHRLAVAAFVSHSEATGGEHAAPVVATVLAALAGPAHQNSEQKRN